MLKKFKIPSYFLRTKWLAILVIAAILIVFARTVDTPVLTKTAIVLGVGVDYVEEQFEVTTQTVIMASSSSESAGQTTYETYTAKGETISAALDDISRKMGLHVSLSHCNVLFLSQETLELDHMQLVYPLTGMYALPEHALIVTGDKSPEDLLAMRVGTTISSPYLLQVALTNTEGTNGMLQTTVKDFLAYTSSRSKAAALPYITTRKMQSPPLSQNGTSEDVYEFDINRSLVFDEHTSYLLDEELSEVLVLYLSHKAKGAIDYKAEDNMRVEFRVIDKKTDIKANGRNITADIKMDVEFLDVQFANTNEVLTGANSQITSAAHALGDKLTGKLNECFELSKSIGIDFLGLKEKAYQSVGRDLEEDCLATLSFNPHVKISVKETA